MKIGTKTCLINQIFPLTLPSTIPTHMNEILYQQHSPQLEIKIAIKIADTGVFTLTGVESGELVEKLEGDSDLEYSISLTEDKKELLKQHISTPDQRVKTDQELLNWIMEHYQHRDAYMQLRELLKGHEIPFSDFRWA